MPAKFRRRPRADAARVSRSSRIIAEALEPRRLLSASLVAQPPPGNFGSNPSQIVSVDGNAFFLASDVADPKAGTGNEALFRLDPSTGAAVRVFQIAAANPSGPSPSGPNPVTLMLYNHDVFFNRAVGNAEELWKSDGTTPGTVKVATIVPDFTQPQTRYLQIVAPTVANGTLFFLAGASLSTTEALWQSDGTPAGTFATQWTIRDPADFPRALISYNNRLYFTPTTGGFWTSDGSPAGTYSVSRNISPLEYTQSNGSLYFSTEGAGASLYKSDGTTLGTAAVPIGNATGPQIDAAAGGFIYFDAQATGLHLFRTDGAGGGTVSLHQFASSDYSGMVPVITAGSKAYFPDNGLWVTDGTVAGTAAVPNAPADANPLGSLGNELFFTSTGSGGREFWETDGTAAGTRLVKALDAGAGGFAAGLHPPIPQAVTDLNGLAYFAADDGSGIGTELWRTDGTTAGAALVADINQTPAPDRLSKFTNLGGALLYQADFYDGPPSRLLVSDGTAAGAKTVVSNFAGANASATLNGVSYWGLYNGARTHVFLWRSDGTAQGARVVADLDPQGLPFGGSPAPFRMAAVGNQIFMIASDGVHGSALWKSDGTAAGTTFVAAADAATPMSDVGGKAFFFGSDGVHGYQPWVSDGTAAGTFMLRQVSTNGGSLAPNTDKVPFIVNHGVAYFPAANSSGKVQLWESDGTTAGTALLADVTPATNDNGYSAGEFASIGSEVYFAATTGGVTGIWKTNGTPAGTVQLAATPSLPGGVVPFGNSLLYTVNVSGSIQLFAIPAAGGSPTSLGSFSSAQNFVQDGGLVYFAANGSLWQTDGTAAGAVVAHAGGSGNVANVNGTLFFSSYDPVYGDQLWEIPPPTAPAAPSSFSAAAASSTSATLSWTDSSADFTGFTVQRSTTANFAAVDESVNVLGNVRSYSDGGLSPATVYYYRLAAFNPAGASAYTTTGPFSTTPPAPATIVDNRAAGVTLTGRWWYSSNESGYYGTDFLNDGNTGKGTKSVQFAPALPSAGTYSVYAWYPAAPGNAANVPVDVVAADGTHTVAVNERSQGNQWVLLGTYPFNAAGAAVVFRTAGTSGLVVADAVEFTQSAPPVVTPPAAPTGLQAVAASSTQVNLTWTDLANNETGYKVEYSTDGVAWLTAGSTAAGATSFPVTGLAPSTAYSFRVSAFNSAGPSGFATAGPVSTPAPPAVNVIVDNRSPGVTLTGRWWYGSNQPGFYGTDFLNDGNTGKGTKSVQFAPALPSAGTYAVYARWPSAAGNAAGVPVDVLAADGTHTVLMNEQSNGGQWVLLGTYSFNAAGAAVVFRTAGTSGLVVADAVQFSKVG